MNNIEQAEQLELRAKILRENLEWEWNPNRCHPEYWRPAKGKIYAVAYTHRVRIKPWTPPALPPHLADREWYKPIRECFEDGKRAFLIGENGSGETIFAGTWVKIDCQQEAMFTIHAHAHCRTSRPLPPAAPEMVPLEFTDINPGDCFRMKGDLKRWWTIAYASDDDISLMRMLTSGPKGHYITYRTLFENWERRHFGQTTWQPCQKPKP